MFVVDFVFDSVIFVASSGFLWILFELWIRASYQIKILETCKHRWMLIKRRKHTSHNHIQKINHSTCHTNTLKWRIWINLRVIELMWRNFEFLSPVDLTCFTGFVKSLRFFVKECQKAVVLNCGLLFQNVFINQVNNRSRKIFNYFLKINLILL